MNEKDTKIVRFRNPFDFDFTPEMGAMYGGVPYFVPAGGSLLCPLTIGDHLATHLARHSIIRKAPIRDEGEVDGKGKDRPLWNDQVIADIKAKLITDAYTEEKPTVMTESQALQAKVASLNDVFPSEQPPADNDHVAAGASQFPAANGVVYQDKAQVIAELDKRGIKFNARLSKASLEKLLTE